MNSLQGNVRLKPLQIDAEKIQICNVPSTETPTRRKKGKEISKVCRSSFTSSDHLSCKTVATQKFNIAKAGKAVLVIKVKFGTIEYTLDIKKSLWYGIDVQMKGGPEIYRIGKGGFTALYNTQICLLYTSPSPRDQRGSRMPSSA